MGRQILRPPRLREGAAPLDLLEGYYNLSVHFKQTIVHQVTFLIELIDLLDSLLLLMIFLVYGGEYLKLDSVTSRQPVETCQRRKGCPNPDSVTCRRGGWSLSCVKSLWLRA